MPTQLAAAVAPLTGHGPEVVLVAATVAIAVGGLLCLAGDEDGVAADPARRLLGLTAGSGLALALANGLATLLLPLLVRA
jgi:hypothetical protein